jgi:hypothetical protein
VDLEPAEAFIGNKTVAADLCAARLVITWSS